MYSVEERYWSEKYDAYSYSVFRRHTVSERTGKRVFLAENCSEDFHIFREDLIVCGICGISDCAAVLCNDCKIIAHADKKGTHGFVCSICGRTICTNYARYYKKGLSKKPVCMECAGMGVLTVKKYSLDKPAWL